ncbi:MAG: DUF5050 domain-containing protein [Candidatus Omnitrophica bacterium]|nr:DUF5050 domain-containing protein [Candidatus Omnitrophota bacterium]
MKRIYFAILIIFLICLIPLDSFAAETEQKKGLGKIVFCQYDGKYWQIWTMDLGGSNRKQLTHSEVDKRYPNLSSDGRRIVYVDNEGKLWFMNSDGSNNAQVPLNISASEPKWCFQGKKIIFTSFRGVSFLDDSDIWIINSDGSGLKKIIRRPSIQFLPDVSKNGNEIIFVDVLELSGHEIFKLDLKTNDYIQLTQNRFHDTAAVFAGDGEKIAYSSDEDGNYDIWIMDKFGQNRKNLTERPAFDSSPAVTSDGKTVFFLSDSSGTRQIWRVDIDGKKLKQITNDNQDKQDISVYASAYEQ